LPRHVHGAAAAAAIVFGAVLCAGAPSVGLAQSVEGSPPVAELPDVVVSASRREQQSFDAPAAIQSIGRDTIDEAGPQVNLSESINRIPGVIARNRQNYAQDLQVSIRGFGSRSTFGIRGLRVLVDGIPATMPDGQGQVSTIDLSSVSRIEVLRGPLAQLYGNAAGGVIQVFTGEGSVPPTAGAGLMFGSDGTRRLGLTASGRWNADQGGGSTASSRRGTGLVADYSDFETDGYRDHSEARRKQFNAKLSVDAGEDTTFSIVANRFDQPLSKDPIGLTRAQAQANPRQVAPIAVTQDARKVVSQDQVGVVAEHRLDVNRSFTARVYAGRRDLENALSVPPAAQVSPTSAGGIVELDRDYGGLGLQYSHRMGTRAGSVLLVAGVDHDRMSERRRGFINDRGVRGALKRDEDDKVTNTDFFGQASWDVSPAWTLIGGLRSSRVKFTTNDYFVTAGNPDDSGSKSFSAVNPVAGVVWHYNERTNLYAHVGRGFETPTFSELGYRPGGASGLNFALNASRSNHAEVGGKFLLSPAHRLDVAVFAIRTKDEIVVDTNSGGRTTFKNAGGTSREGIELSYRGQLAKAWSTTAAWTWLEATFREGFQSAAGTVEAGNRLPGVPAQQLFAELAWTPNRNAGPFAGVEVIRTGSVQVNDLNSDAAPSATLGNLRGGWRFPVGPWRFTLLARLDNVTDKRYFGSVIVNDGNDRFFEPAPGRTWLLAAQAGYRF
jgi:iron complex outermembrane receptor protein